MTGWASVSPTPLDGHSVGWGAEGTGAGPSLSCRPSRLKREQIPTKHILPDPFLLHVWDDHVLSQTTAPDFFPGHWLQLQGRPASPGILGL